MSEELKMCDYCGCEVSYVRGSLWHGEDQICRPCFFTWYDEGLTDKEAIKAHRLKVYGTEDTQEFKSTT
jgi:hypothetical protein